MALAQLALQDIKKSFQYVHLRVKICQIPPRVWSIKNCKNIFHYCVDKKPKKPKFDKISELLTLTPFQNGT